MAVSLVLLYKQFSQLFVYIVTKASILIFSSISHNNKRLIHILASSIPLQKSIQFLQFPNQRCKALNQTLVLSKKTIDFNPNFTANFIRLK